jgi:hypothetical protein
MNISAQMYIKFFNLKEIFEGGLSKNKTPQNRVTKINRIGLVAGDWVGRGTPRSYKIGNGSVLHIFHVLSDAEDCQIALLLYRGETCDSLLDTVKCILIYREKFQKIPKIIYFGLLIQIHQFPVFISASSCVNSKKSALSAC